MRKKLNDGPVLRERPARYDANGKLTHRGNFFIDHIGATPRQTPTGCSFVDAREHAEALAAAKVKLHEYNVAQFAKKAAAGAPQGVNLDAEHVKIGDLILFYLHNEVERINGMADHRRREHLAHIECLSSFWGDRSVVEINKVNSLAYQKDKKPSVVRNKLILLKSIINYGAGQTQIKLHEGQLDYAQPSRNTGRVDVYNIDELIAMYKTARRKRTTWFENRPERVNVLYDAGEDIYNLPTVKAQRVSGHIAKFILVAVLTGTRSARIQEASFVKEAGRPWVDLDNGIFYRTPLNEKAALNKQADPIRIPIRLLRMMRRWHKGSATVPGCRYLIEYNGRPVDCRKGFYTLKHQVLSKDRAEVLNRHSLKHTAVTMLLAMEISVESVARYVSTTKEVIYQIYDHWIPDEMSEVHRALAEKQPKRLKPGEKPSERKAA